MKFTKFILLLLTIFIFSCGGKEASNKETYENVANEATNTEVKKEDVKKEEVKTDKNYEKLIVGSWYNLATVSGEDLIFNNDGTFDYHSGNVVDNGTWKIENDFLTFFSVKYKIIELTDKKLVIEDDLGKTTYERMN